MMLLLLLSIVFTATATATYAMMPPLPLWCSLSWSCPYCHCCYDAAATAVMPPPLCCHDAATVMPPSLLLWYCRHQSAADTATNTAAISMPIQYHYWSYCRFFYHANATSTADVITPQSLLCRCCHLCRYHYSLVHPFLQNPLYPDSPYLYSRIRLMNVNRSFGFGAGIIIGQLQCLCWYKMWNVEFTRYLLVARFGGILAPVTRNKPCTYNAGHKTRLEQKKIKRCILIGLSLMFF